jgi:hypothetical protein
MQIYLTELQRRRIDQVAKARGVTTAEIVRRALDAYLAADLDLPDVLAATFAAVPDASLPSRDEWDRR